MKIAIPVVSGEISTHFGHCETFEIIDIDPDQSTIVSTKSIPAPEHQPGLLPQWLADQGAELLIAGGIGNRAKQLFDEHKIEVIAGVESGTPQQLVNQYMQGSLRGGNNICDH